MNEQTPLDRFSKQSNTYVSARPRYPEEIYKFLSGISPARTLAWDCGTGNGQAAIHLVEYFDHVYANDLSQNQIQNAFQHERIKYDVCTAEDANLQEHSVDLITVAQAIHWFDLEKFYAITNKALKPNGIIALWAYGFISADDQALDSLFQKVGKEILHEYWDPQVHKIWKGYDQLDFPFKEVEHPQWHMHIQWSRTDFISYIESWSAARKYQDTNNQSIISEIITDLEKLWPDPNIQQTFRSPITSRIGRII